MRARPLFSLLVFGAVGLGTVGCGSDNTSPSTTPPPPGTYALTSLQNPPNPPLTPPIATGTLGLTATTYDVTINVQGQPPVQDQGTYSISGSGWSQMSTTNPGIQSTGTYTYNSATGALSVDVTSSGVRTIADWQKQ
jgi:hypothetical protein